MQLWLVLFHGEQIVPSRVPDASTYLALTEDGIAGDDRAFQRQAFQKCERGRDFVLLRLDDQIADQLVEIVPIAGAERINPNSLPRLKANLARYERREPCRVPFTDDEIR